MNQREEIDASCPYCGEPITLLVDCSELGQACIEDCQVCCRPIVVRAIADMANNVSVELSREDD